MKHFFFLAALSGSLLLGSMPELVAAQEMEAAPTSQLANVALPTHTLRIKPQFVPRQISDALAQVMASGGAKVKQGQNEVLTWTGKNYKPARIQDIKAHLEKAVTDLGWTYTENALEPVAGAQGAKAQGAEVQNATLVSIVRTLPTRKALIGFWVPLEDSLVLAWTEMLPNGPQEQPLAAPPALPSTSKAPNPAADAAAVPDAPATPAGARAIEVAANARYVNVMKGLNPKIPAFPPLAPKPGLVRGYVKDWTGKPLANARLGVRSTAVGGAYSGSAGKSDDKGYYEFAVPFGAAHFYAGGYTVDWGEGRAALSLHPADGEMDGFASNVGGVENFVLLPYGIANRDKVSENPHYSGNYYGGSFTIGYSINEGDGFSDKGLPPGSQIEITLTPNGMLFDGTQGQVLVLHKQIEAGGYHFFYVNNVPLGLYEISVQCKGAPLNLKETGPAAGQEFGLSPKQARGKATLTFRPYGAQAEITTPGNGIWRDLNITLER